MNASIIHDPAFQHGSKYGYILGCRGAHCPAPMNCRTVHTRYVGDWAFRKAIDAGEASADIAAREQQTAQEALEAAKKARRARPGTRAPGNTGDRRADANKARRDGQTLIPRHQLRELLNKGLTDRQIAERLGLKRRQITGARNTAGFERNPDKNRRSVPNTAPVTTGASSFREAT